jgi:hypothetical protein
MNDTEIGTVNDTFLNIMEQEFPEEAQCESSHCLKGRIKCQGKAVAIVSSRVCNDPSRKICIAAVLLDHQIMSSGINCLYCTRRGDSVRAEDCWEIVPL